MIYGSGIIRTIDFLFYNNNLENVNYFHYGQIMILCAAW